MVKISDMIEKLKDILSKEQKDGKIFDKDVALALGISQANFATMKTRNKIPFGHVLDFCALKKISINWLLYGQDPSSLVDSTDKYWIRYYPELSMSAGGGANLEDDTFEQLDIPDYFVKMLGGYSKLKTIEAINVTGESMEPTLNDNDIIFVDISKNTYSKDGIYAIYTEDGLLVKRLQKRTDSQFDVISDNKVFQNQVIYKNDLTIYGKVISSFGSVF
ncbi:putative phage repressor [hydrothermal vent metagenome]|uniref:Putative phage repressor n=1 Tax=hydrothermal vent metagenome TaxID=652676 RepID=A0A3B1E924_9ZZZZ